MNKSGTLAFDIDKEGFSLEQNIEHVYIGVFFDGTNNNMLWSARKKIKDYHKKLNIKDKIDRIIKPFEDDFNIYCKKNNKKKNDIDAKIEYIRSEILSGKDKILSEEDKKDFDTKIKSITDSFNKEYNNEYNNYYIDKKKDDNDTKLEFIKSKINEIEIFHKSRTIADNVYNNHSDYNKNEKGEYTKENIDLFIKTYLTKKDKEDIIKKHQKDFDDFNFKKSCSLKDYPDCKNCKKKELCKDIAYNEFIKKLIIDGKYEDQHAIRIFQNAHTIYKPTMLGGFSNVAILYSAYNPQPKKTNCKTYKIYIEGSGARDITNNNVLESESNLNGLGFGLGNTGVVALVSKAVYYVNNYIESIKNTFSAKVEIHFNVFGFSRGSSCSRLFSYLVTRNNGKTLGIREKEFADFYAKGLYIYNNKEKIKRLHFLDNYNKTVDFLGIYDTVVSIGFLLQKDGYVNPLAIGYKNKITGLHADNYIANWHCNNVSEYGMYCTSSKYTENHEDKIKSIFHICAMDEYRENFALTNVGKEVGANALEIYIPGCHSDIGGGYYDGDEEQEILLRKSVQKGEAKDSDDWDKRRNTKNIIGYNAHLINPSDKKVYWGKCHYQKWHYQQIGDNSFKEVCEQYFGKEDTDIAIKKWLDQTSENKKEKTNNYIKDCEQVFGKEDTDNAIKKWLDQTSENKKEKTNNYIKDCEQVFGKDLTEKVMNLESGLEGVGWIDENWSNDKKRKEIELNGDNVPCTIRITNGPKYLKFKRNVKAGYSNIPLHMMVKYAKEQLNEEFNTLFDQKYIDKEYPIPPDLTKMTTMPTLKKGHRYWIYPKEEDYKKLRMKYLHFTSTYKIKHFSKPKNGVKLWEGSLGNIANTPNQDLDGRICRIVYHGDQDEHSLYYMYEYGDYLGEIYEIDGVNIELFAKEG